MNRRFQRVSAVLLLTLFAGPFSRRLHGQTPPPRDIFAILPIFEQIGGLRPKGNEKIDFQAEMDKLKVDVGQNHGRFRVGFAHIFRDERSLLRHCELAQKNNLSVGVIIAVQTHNRIARDAVRKDFRCTQWRLDGKTWQGEQFDKTAQVEFPARDWEVPTPSRYCDAVHNEAMALAFAKAQLIRRTMLLYPGVIVVVNATVEEELATGGETRDGLLADYSPYAITEFRDWLRHTGKYDDTSGEYPGQGASAQIVGPFVSVNGAMRPQFYDDPTPDDANKTGKSFNQWFGTKFSTWTLRSWDLQRFDSPITDKNFNPMPNSGPGFTAGGFDAPRVRDPKNVYWCAWSWDVADHHGQYPPGNPAHPAFGFRQVEVKHFVSDVLDQARKGGIPLSMLYAHQIPGEQVDAARARSGADPIWTGYYAPAGTLGITRFGPLDVNKITQYSHNWGIFEWHPRPFSKPDDRELYKAATQALNLYSHNGGHIFFAGWWQANGKIDKIFPMNDSQFAKAIHDWLAAHMRAAQ